MEVELVVVAGEKEEHLCGTALSRESEIPLNEEEDIPCRLLLIFTPLTETG